MVEAAWNDGVIEKLFVVAAKCHSTRKDRSKYLRLKSFVNFCLVTANLHQMAEKVDYVLAPPPPKKKAPKSKPAIFYWICSSKTCLNVYFHLSTKKVTPCEFSSLVNSLTLRENIFLLQWSMVWGKKYISLQLSQVERSFRGTLKRRDVPSLLLLLLLVLPVTFCLDKVKVKNEPWVAQNTLGKLWPFLNEKKFVFV